jgi:hypothetical protein
LRWIGLWRKIESMSAKQEPVTEDRLRNFKYFGKILPLLDRLHDAGTARDKAGNRILHFDQYIALQLLFFFNPVITSLRGMVQASHLRKVQQELGVSPTSLGSLSEAGNVFDADLLKPIIAELGLQLQPLTHDARLDDLPGVLTAVDGTELTALAELVEAGWQGRGIKLHTHFEPLKGVPADMDLTLADASEVDHLLAHLQPGRVYVKDRGYCCFRLFQAIVDIGSHFVCRARDNSVYQVIEDRPLSAEARACKPHHKRSGHTGRGGPEQGEVLLIATDLLDVPAEVIALIYRKRWTVELFFRFFKYVLGCRHLLSHGANGIEIQVYLAIIVCMLIALWTGRKPTLRTIEMIRLHFIGWAELDELEAHIAKLQPLPV